MIGAVTLGLSRFVVYTPLFNQQTIAQVTDDDNKSIAAYEADESPYRGGVLDGVIHVADLFSNYVVKYAIGRNNMVQSLVSTAALYPLRTARARIAVRDEGVKGFPKPVDSNASFYNGIPIALLHTALTIGISDYALFEHIKHYLSRSAVIQDDKALNITAETGSLLVAKLLLLPLEISFKRQQANAKNVKNLSKTWARAAIWTVLEVSLGLAEYWFYRTLNRNIYPEL